MASTIVSVANIVSSRSAGGGYLEVPQTRQEATSTHKPVENVRTFLTLVINA